MNANSASILKVFVGQPQSYVDVLADDRRPPEWRTAFYKLPVAGKVRVLEDRLTGDDWADRKNHGGIENAVLMYAAAHYDCWREELPEQEWEHGGFGENLTVDGLTEADVCIGDRWRVGTALLEISKPRQPCWKLCRRWQLPDLAKRVVQTGRGGWYYRVRETGEVAAGDVITLVDRPCPDWTVLRTSRLFFGLDPDPVAAKQLAMLPSLSLNWREQLLSRWG